MSFLWVLLFWPAAVLGAATVETGHTRVTITSETASFAPGRTFWLAIEMTPQDGWYTYWRNPGDAGLRNRFNWRLPEGFAAGEILWSIPEKFETFGLVTYGYRGPSHALVPITVPADYTGTDVDIGLHAEWLVCEIQCIPEEADLAVTLAAGDASLDPVQAGAFASFRAGMPQPSPWPASLAGDGEKVEITVYFNRDEAARVNRLTVFPYKAGLINYKADADFTAAADGLVLTIPRPDAPAAFDGAAALLKIDWRDGSSETVILQATGGLPGSGAGEPAVSIPEITIPLPSLGLGKALLFAFLGGVILNLMPCVFPVLSLKALSFANLQEDAAKARIDGLYYTLGVVLSFLGVAGLMIGLRAGGEGIGWGFQLQSPGFVLVLSLMLFTVALSLAGLISFGARFAGIGDQLARKTGPAGAFFTGILATVVATPCTAPFMASAIGFGLTQAPSAALAIFAALGFGLAFPFLLISFVPRLHRVFPRPGPWMEIFKQALSFPVLATVIWLLWILALQAGALAVAIALSGMLLIAFLFWLWKVMPGTFPAILTAITLAFYSMMVVGMLRNATPSAALKTETAAVAFSPATLSRLTAEGQAVFVNFTAAWCITCIVNERTTLSDPAVEAFFQANDIVMMKADWTNQNPEIAATLEQYGRAGIPLYLFFNGEGAPLILPPVLTPDGLIEDLTDFMAVR